MEYNKISVLNEYQASSEEKKLYSIKRAVIGLIEFVITSLEELGIDTLHEMTDPSLDALDEILCQLDTDASAYGDLNLKQAILLAQILINDIRQKNPDLCAQSSRILKGTSIL